MNKDEQNEKDLERYLNDPEFRRKKIQEKKAFDLSKKEAKESASFSLKKPQDKTEASTVEDQESGKANEKKSGNSQLNKPHLENGNGVGTSVSGSSATSAPTSPTKSLSESSNKSAGNSSTTPPNEPSSSADVAEISLYSAPGWGKILGVYVLSIIIAAGGVFLYLYSLTGGMPSIEELENPETDIASFVYSRDGVVLDKYFTENRTYVSFDKISPHAVNALLAIEDHRFYNHWGIDAIRLAGLPYYWLQGRVHGGSTITMQLARNLYKKIGREVSVSRKLSEMMTSLQIERNYTKREIIEMYLNTVEFPNSSFGIEAAAQTHFGKPAQLLNVLESAVLIGSLQAIYYYNPRIFPDRAKRKRNIVLAKMGEHGFIKSEEVGELQSREIALDYHPPFKTGRKSRYFGEYVRQKVSDWASENGYDLYRDGLIIHTTIDSRLQKHAENAVREKLDSLQVIFMNEWTTPNGAYMDKLWRKHPSFLNSFLEETQRYRQIYDSLKVVLPEDKSIHLETLAELRADTAFVAETKRKRTRLESGFTAIDPSNGHILAWVGGTDYSQFQFDHVNMARRQAGSTFKPFVYAVAIDNGYPPYFKVSKYPTKFYNRQGQVWHPSDERIASGEEFVTLRTALAKSMNNVTVRLLPELAGKPGTNRLEDLFPAAQKIADMAHRLGIKSPISPYPSIALGTAEVTLLELVSAYTTFANKGVHIDPLAITRIEDKEGNVLVEYKPEYQREAISPETAYIVVDMLRGVIRGMEDGIATGIRLRNIYGVRQDIAGKTGTTQNSADNWFVAMTPHIVMGAWVGGEDRRIRFPDNTYIGQGARTALPIVGTFINAASSDPLVDWGTEAFEQPAGFVMPTPPVAESNKQDKDGKLGRVGW